MQRGKLRNIINKSKTISNKQIVGEPFDEFKKSLPKEIEIGDDYRLEAAWKAYGSPKDYRQAIWEGMIQPIDENTYKLPSIGYNEETEEYEYLNKGKENETVAKDIRVWDNDVIPFVQELKKGGYVRTYNEQKECWTYSKNKPQEDSKVIENNSVEEVNQDVEFLKDGGKKENITLIVPSFLTLDEYENYISKYYSDDDQAEDLKWYRSKESKDFRKQFKLNDLDWEDGSPDGKPFMYIPKKKYQELLFKKFRSNGFGGGTFKDPNGEIGDGMPLKPTGQYAPDGQELYESPTGELFTLKPQAFKQGGQMNVIPEGALHARKNNMEGAGEDFTAKGIPVVDNKGEQQAEIEKEEWTMTKELTDDVESWYKKYYDEETSQKEKDELTIKCGKRITEELLHNTDDRANLITKMLEEEE